MGKTLAMIALAVAGICLTTVLVIACELGRFVEEIRNPFDCDEEDEGWQ